MIKSVVALLFALVAVSHAFTVGSSSRASTSLNSAFEGKAFDITKNAYSRGGKNSWEFEYDTMYVEEPKPKKIVAKAAPKKAAKKVVAKKAVPKKVVAQKKTVAKKAAAPGFLTGLFNKD